MSNEEFEEEFKEDYDVYRIDRVNQLNRAFTVIFTEAMQSLKPLKDIEKLRAKITFIDGNIRKLLKNTGINGWSYKALENIFDVETNKRLVGAALIVKDKVLNEINSKNPYLKYTSTAVDAILEREKPKIVSGVVE